jgi:hypothetical protein
VARPQIPDGLRPAHRLALDAGWTVECASGGHVHWRSPSGALVVTAKTSRSRRAVKNAVADLRRAGLEVPAR